ncbi:MAG: FtsX-like permease family protein [Pseudomonadota bacterium]|nr:ABC transporter permease [Gammaproteobacteria bacterium]HIL85889.1 ABC transporter permease [Pseudomonadales bacterium]
MNRQNLPAMAWRNLWRNRRRTLLTLFSIVFGVFLAIMFTALQDRNWSDMIDLAAKLGGGHVTIAHTEYQDAPSLKKSVVGSAELLRIVSTVTGVRRVAERISGHVMLNTTYDSFGAAFIAFDPKNETENTLSLLSPDALLTGKMFAAADEKGIILGHRLAENLGAELGNKIVYTMTDKQGDIVSGLARLSGTIKTGAPGLDASLGLLPIATVRRIVGYAADENTQLAVFVDDQRNSGAIADELAQAVNATGVAVLPWYENQPDLAAFIAMKVGGTRFISAFIALLVAAGIFNTLFVSVMERLREFGILTAIGFSPGRLFTLVMLESLWLALVGLAGAAALTIAPYRYLAAAGIDVSQVLAEQGTIDVAGVAMSTVLKVGIFPESVVMICTVAVIATLVAGIYPAWRASTVEPVEAIKLV